MSSSEKIAATREAWLLAAIEMFRPMFKVANAELPKSVRVSVGFAYGARKENKKIMGQTWSREASEDGVSQVFISPELGDTFDVLETLVHELVHVADNNQSDHRGQFVVIAKKLGLMSPYSFTPASPSFAAELLVMAEELGHYPHAELHTRVVNAPVVAVGPDGVEVPATVKWHSGPAKQGTRLIKCQCAECGYTVRVTMKWINEAGAPVCPNIKRHKGNKLVIMEAFV